MANCTTCYGRGGSFDSGFWYDCPTCKKTLGSWVAVDQMPPINLPISPSKGIEQVRREMVKHPEHYKHPSGIECIDVVQHMGFNLGNAVKYIWRADLKNDAIEDMKKAIQYLEFEIAKRTKK